jgi:transcription antitermination factor NusG
MTLEPDYFLATTEVDPADSHWYAVRVRSNYESMTSALLRGKGIEEFYPTYKSLRQWSDRSKEIRRPLFPGYIFCRIDLPQRVPVLSTAGVVNIVGVGRTPVAISDPEIEAVRAIVDSGVAATPCPYIQVGHPVSIVWGPLAGVEGIVTEVKSQLRLLVSVQLLRRSVAAEIDRAWIRPAPVRQWDMPVSA